ncbi:helix-turn-helix transcriptional regulator [Streptomyces sp. TRM68416]|uniref:helix-turn-helix transcriptional regulator n=1 Tax=Streptomyces sp. TRM68416 TaxID=2758412 RepID=UPI0016618CE1|nr:LuxR family transcriptional regulator [Streptomyces sp. TRM68416]MBD0838665.1 helix-turn-helix transcriptional regulator [Streptomyces sp. TRM68416]
MHRHPAEEVCAAGLELYTRALRDGRVRQAEGDLVPCVLDRGLLRPILESPGWLRPVAPAVMLPRLLGAIEEQVAEHRRHETWLAEAFQPLLTMGVRRDLADISLVQGKERINETIGDTMRRATAELLVIQPGGKRPHSALGKALAREQDMLARGCRMRTLYQHTTRHDPAVLAHYELLKGDVEVRTLDEVPERLIVIDRTVAFVPANPDRSLAVEVRHQPLVTYLATTFDRLWHLATPMYPEAVQQPTLNGITPRQRAIARLLVEGHTDAVIADRLGMNVRTARVHIAKLAATLGSESRAQLGYLIAESGILRQEGDGR